MTEGRKMAYLMDAYYGLAIYLIGWPSAPWVRWIAAGLTILVSAMLAVYVDRTWHLLQSDRET